MRKTIFSALALMLALLLITGCAAPAGGESAAPSGDSTPPTTEQTLSFPDTDNAQQTPDDAAVPLPGIISPLPVTVDMAALNDCTVAVSLEEGAISKDGSGALQIRMTVYTYDLYDMVDMAQLQEGDRIILRGQEVVVETLSRTDAGAVVINGGLDMGGYELLTSDNGVFFETGYSDMKSWFPVGEATLPLSATFTFADSSDPGGCGVVYSAEDFQAEPTPFFHHFVPQNTSVVIEDGIVTAMKRIYIP